MPKTNRPILALDPGLRDLGYAAFRGQHLLTSGVLSLRQIPRHRRIRRVREEILRWLRAYRARAIVVEQIPRRPLGSSGGLPALGRSIERLARKRRLPLRRYSARTVRRTVIGNGWAGKREVATAMARRFPDLRVHLTHDRKWKESYWANMFDAVALGLHHQALPLSRSRHSG